jgi:hypothetical protein
MLVSIDFLFNAYMHFFFNDRGHSLLLSLYLSLFISFSCSVSVKVDVIGRVGSVRLLGVFRRVQQVNNNS